MSALELDDDLEIWKAVVHDVQCILHSVNTHCDYSSVSKDRPLAIYFCSIFLYMGHVSYIHIYCYRYYNLLDRESGY